MTVGELRELLVDLPTNLPVHVNDVLHGEYIEADIDAFHFKGDDQDEPAFVINAGA